MTSIPSIRAAIWEAANHDLERVNRSISACPNLEDTVEWWQRVYDHLVICPPRKAAKRRGPVPGWVKERYSEAHRLHQLSEYPSSSKDFGTIKTVMPDTTKANGLTNFVINFLLWSGHRATRITSAGRVIKTKGTTKYIPSGTRRGAADISSTIKVGPYGISCQLEVKIANDKPSEHQLREQEIEESAGGKYFFIKTPEDFLLKYDSLFVNSLSGTKNI